MGKKYIVQHDDSDSSDNEIDQNEQFFKQHNIVMSNLNTCLVTKSQCKYYVDIKTNVIYCHNTKTNTWLLPSEMTQAKIRSLYNQIESENESKSDDDSNSNTKNDAKNVEKAFFSLHGISSMAKLVKIDAKTKDAYNHYYCKRLNKVFSHRNDTWYVVPYHEQLLKDHLKSKIQSKPEPEPEPDSDTDTDSESDNKQKFFAENGITSIAELTLIDIMTKDASNHYYCERLNKVFSCCDDRWYIAPYNKQLLKDYVDGNNKVKNPTKHTKKPIHYIRPVHDISDDDSESDSDSNSESNNKVKKLTKPTKKPIHYVRPVHNISDDDSDSEDGSEDEHDYFATHGINKKDLIPMNLGTKDCNNHYTHSNGKVYSYNMRRCEWCTISASQQKQLLSMYKSASTKRK
jgi:hypothetical protein